MARALGLSGWIRLLVAAASPTTSGTGLVDPDKLSAFRIAGRARWGRDRSFVVRARSCEKNSKPECGNVDENGCGHGWGGLFRHAAYMTRKDELRPCQ